MTAPDELLAFLNQRLAGHFLVNEPLCDHTWYRIGGPADFFVVPPDREALCAVAARCRSLAIDTCVLGEGANVLVSDRGFRGAVVGLRRLGAISREGGVVTAEAGVALRDLVYYCETAGLGGVACLAGIPGTVGGALIMNAGTDDGEIGDVVGRVESLHDGSIRALPRTEIAFGYRSAPQLQGDVVVGCTLSLDEQDAEELRRTRMSLLARRSAKQPLEYPSCGSVFKRPPNRYVGRMVEEAGLKGVRRGDAMISEKHGGFIVNLGGARADDVRFLIDKVRSTILARFGVELETEVRLVGF